MTSLSVRHASARLRRCLQPSQFTPKPWTSSIASRSYATYNSTAARRTASTSTPTAARRTVPASTTTTSTTTPAAGSAAEKPAPPPTTTRNAAATAPPPTPTPSAPSSLPNGTSNGNSVAGDPRDLSDGLSDTPLDAGADTSTQPDWSRSFHGMSRAPFSAEAAAALLAPVSADDIEVKPDGIIYLPEIKYRRILNRAFGPGGWGLAPRGETIVTGKTVTREYGLVAGGRLVSIARGEQQYFDAEGIPTATEGCKSNALMRCCKDLGVASELWDPRFIRRFMKEYSKKVWVEHVGTKKRKQITIRKDDEVGYPWKEIKGVA